MLIVQALQVSPRYSFILPRNWESFLQEKNSMAVTGAGPQIIEKRKIDQLLAKITPKVIHFGMKTS